MRSVPETLIGLIETPVSWGPVLILLPVDFSLMYLMRSAVSGLATFELDAGIKVFRVLADDDQIDRHLVEETANAFVLFARTDAGIQAERLSQVDVDAAKAVADRRGDGSLGAHTSCA